MSPQRAPFSTVEHASMPERVRDVIAASIRDGRLQNGQALPSQDELAKQFGVSRLVIREALRALEAVGAVSLGAGRRAVVLGSPGSAAAGAWQSWLVNTRDEHLELVSIRLVLEQLATERAAEHATDDEIDALRANVALFEREAAAPIRDLDRLMSIDVEFHRLIAEAARAKTLAKLIAEVAAAISESRRAGMALPRTPDMILADHRRILAGIEAHDSAAAGAALREHLTGVLRTLESIGKQDS